MNRDRWLQGLFLVFVIAIAGSFTVVRADDPVTSDVTTYVDDDGDADFASIQAAIDNASAGDTIFVYNGTYHENIVVHTAINLVGESRNATIIDGGDSGDVVNVTADGTNISGFTIRNSNSSKAGLTVGAAHVTISGCNITDNARGIVLHNANYTTISSNWVQDNDGNGIEAAYSGHCTYFHNIIKNNIQPGDPPPNAAGIFMDNCHYSTVENNLLAYNDVGMSLLGCYNVTVCNNTASSNGFHGIGVSDSGNVTVYNNTISNNTDTGLYIAHVTSPTVFYDNIIRDNDPYGAYLGASQHCLLYRNLFIDNAHQSYDSSTSAQQNQWDNGSVGNYWSDYTGSDSNQDGIGDTPYGIPGGSSEDRYPLVDIHPPVSSIVLIGTAGDNGWYVSNVTVNLTGQDADSSIAVIRYKINDQEWQVYNGPFNLTTDGRHTIAYYAVDLVGNVEEIQTADIRIDTQPPEITCYLEPDIPDGDSGWYTGHVEVTLVASDNTSAIQSIRHRLNQDPWEDYTGYFIITEEGNHTFSYSATDGAGHQVTKSLHIKMDATAPVVNLTPPATDYVKGTLAVNWTAIDSVDPDLDGSITLELVQENDSTTLATGLNSTGPYLWNTQAHPDGACQLRITATDEAGNTGTNTSHSFIVDNTPPTVIIDQPRGGEVLGGDDKTLRIFWNATDTVDSNLDGTIWIAYSSDNGETWVDMVKGTTNSGEFTYGIREWDNGNYRLRINATDEAGNTGSAVSNNFTIDKTPPTVTITNPDPGYLYINLFGRDIIPPIPISFIPRPLGFLPTTVIVGQVTVTASASDEFSDISRVEIRAGDSTHIFDSTPYRFDWDPPIGLGGCSIEATARDLAGNTATDTLTGIFCINI